MLATCPSAEGFGRGRRDIRVTVGPLPRAMRKGSGLKTRLSREATPVGLTGFEPATP